MLASVALVARRLARRLDRAAVPRRIAAQFRSAGAAELDAIRSSVQEHYFPRYPQRYLDTPAGREDLHQHVLGRLDEHRSQVVPWLDSARPLRGAKVLEIGCGTGCCTVAMAEQGAEVVGIDLDEPALEVARKRSAVYGLSARFQCMNATEAHRELAGERFDFIVFYASLEHMTLPERLTAMQQAWQMLPEGGLWCVVETPNRLWYHDYHTSNLPFYHWLPDDLAFAYARYSPRESFRDCYPEETPEQRLHFLRRGRGVSYHEFDLAIQPVAQLKVVSSLSAHRRRRLLRRLAWQWSAGASYERFLAKLCPTIDRAFLQPSLDLILRK